jgi:hypothetical protein
VHESRPQPRGQGSRLGQSGTALQLRRREATRQLEQGERVPGRLGKQPRAHVIGRRGRAGREQLGGCLGTEAADHEFGQAGRGELAGRALADREHHRQRLGREPARAEDQRLRRREVQELRVVDQAHKRAVIGRRRQQAERRGRDQEAIGLARWREPECAGQRGRLCLGQLAQLVHDRTQQAVQAGKGQV